MTRKVLVILLLLLFALSSVQVYMAYAKAECRECLCCHTIWTAVGYRQVCRNYLCCKVNGRWDNPCVDMQVFDNPY